MLDAKKKRRRWPRSVGRVLGILLGIAILVVAVSGVWLRAELRGSLPQLDGQSTLAGLSAPATIERDAQGVPTIRAANRLDLARATGWLHAQDRFFQMDLLRRRSAGELARLFGPAALPADRRSRVHRFRSVARASVELLDDESRRILDAYAEGVNAGLASLHSRPPEYIALRQAPAPWTAEDSLLVVSTMYMRLQSDGPPRESSLGLLHDLLPPELARFLAPEGTIWDAPLAGGTLPGSGIPGPEVFDLRASQAARVSTRPAREPGPEQPWASAAGSNNWAVSGEHTIHGGAILANDMHLGLSLPNIWYRASFIWTGDEDVVHTTGVTLPGVPAMIVGSNGRIAWGFTNSQGDWADLVVVEVEPDDEDRYRTADGSLAFQRDHERIEVARADDELLEVVSTIWGPVFDHDHRGRPRALRWIAHDPGKTDVQLMQLEVARDVDEAVAIANRSGIPTQNFVVADAGGRVGWTLIGPIPRRFGFDGRRPVSWADGERGWDGSLTPDEYPRLLDPEDGRLWTANNRTVGGEMLARIGNGGFDLGARAGQIRDGLFELEQASERDLLAVQLDDRALFLERWRQLLLDTLDEAAVAEDPRRGVLRRWVQESWTGRASVDSVGYRMVRGFRRFLARQVFEPLTATCTAADERFSFFRIGQSEGPLWKLVSERPEHLLNPDHATWRAQLLAAVDELIDYFSQDGSLDLSQKSWGDYNTVRLRHPLSQVAPFLSRWLDMNSSRLPGDSNMPRVQTPGFGASERMIVSPGREQDGIFHLPGGASGHPLSPYYRSGHEAWVRGEPSPFLPGTTVHSLTLQPE